MMASLRKLMKPKRIDIIRASEKADKRILQVIKKLNIDIDVYGRESWPFGSALQYQIFFNNIEAIRFLLENGADPNHLDFSLTTPIHWAAVFGHLDALKLMYEHHGDINIMSGNNQTPLLFAATNGEEEVISWLIAQGADIHCHDTFSNSPLRIAIVNGFVGSMKLLIKLGLDIEDTNYRLETPIYGAIRYYDPDISLEMVKILLDNNANVDHQNKFGQTPLDIAHDVGNQQVVKEILNSLGIELDD
ncbi:Serine/threonine-protein phosphatase 6 regulatory ankyrin repeat subunit A [Trichoplax sp. H2]|nr:Serine/threonine-protein phosphatase 6 regulatory ankyrin repeat subunit A [Trichoplax sp. H2]|eukprot:RDD36855.1 Serine/threonine-protein phosphatase 6 regulatory ankyrin repeat subunit A [Trichoplax sp. H2]